MLAMPNTISLSCSLPPKNCVQDTKDYTKNMPNVVDRAPHGQHGIQSQESKWYLEITVHVPCHTPVHEGPNTFERLCS